MLTVRLQCNALLLVTVVTYRPVVTRDQCCPRVLPVLNREPGTGRLVVFRLAGALLLSLDVPPVFRVELTLLENRGEGIVTELGASGNDRERRVGVED